MRGWAMTSWVGALSLCVALTAAAEEPSPYAATAEPEATRDGFDFLAFELVSDGMRAGYDRGFFLEGNDGAFGLDIGGQMQFRYLANFRNNPDDGESTTTGFQHRRTKLGFTGRLADPDIRFRVRPVVSRNGGGVSVDDVWLSYGLTDALTIKAGSFKLPFTRETLLSSTRLQTVERSYVNARLGFGRSTGVELAYNDGGAMRLAAMFSDGATSHFEGFQNTPTDYALTARADVKLAGDWSQARDFSGYSDHDFGAFAGGAVHYEAGNTDSTSVDYFSWTVDGSVYMQNVGVYAAVIGRHDTRVASGAAKFDDLGWLVQGGYMIDDRVEPFARFEQLIPDSGRAGAHTVNLVTAGVNWYINGHALKWSSDVVWALNSMSGFAGASDGLGLLADNPMEKNQVVIRSQVQLLF